MSIFNVVEERREDIGAVLTDLLTFLAQSLPHFTLSSTTLPQFYFILPTQPQFTHLNLRSSSLYLTLLYLQPLYLILLDLQPIYHTSPTLPHFLIFASFTLYSTTLTHLLYLTSFVSIFLQNLTHMVLQMLYNALNCEKSICFQNILFYFSA